MRARSQTMIPISNLNYNKEILKKQALLFVRHFDRITYNIGFLSLCRIVARSLDRSHFST